MSDCPRHSHQFPPTKAPQNLKRIVQRITIGRYTGRDSRRFRGKACVIDAGAPPCPIGSIPAL